MLHCPRHSTAPAHAWPGDRGCASQQEGSSRVTLCACCYHSPGQTPSLTNTGGEWQKVPLLLEPILCCCFLLLNLSQTGNSPEQNSKGLPPLQKHSHLDVLVVGQASGILKSSLNLCCVKQGLTVLLGLTQDKLGEMGQDRSHKSDQMTQCSPLVLYS